MALYVLLLILQLNPTPTVWCAPEYFREEPHTFDSIRTSTLWVILSSAGVTTSVVNWPLTYPAPAVNGHIVSDRYARQSQATSGSGKNVLYLPDLEVDARRAMLTVDQESSFRPAGLEERHLMASRADRTYDRVFQTITRHRPSQVRIVRYQTWIRSDTTFVDTRDRHGLATLPMKSVACSVRC